MKHQKIFNFKFKKKNDEFNFYINSTNYDAYHGILNKNNKNIFLSGPKKSGKTLLSNIWLTKNKAIKYKNNFDFIIDNYTNLLIEDIDYNSNQEKLFHILNHCHLNNLNIMITSSLKINEINFNLNDLTSRLKSLNYFKINQPDDDMLLNILTKLFTEKQFVINSLEIFQYILKRANRSYLEMFTIVEKLDTLSLEKKRQLTIPLIKEIL